MGRFYGKVGFTVNGETSPGVWVDGAVEERYYYMDLTRNANRFRGSGEVNDDFTISNTVSFISDHYSSENVSKIRYVEFMGSKWKVESVEIKPPRLFLTIGGVYNG